LVSARPSPGGTYPERKSLPGPPILWDAHYGPGPRPFGTILDELNNIAYEIGFLEEPVPASTLEGPDAFILISPVTELTSGDSSALRDFVRSGHGLLLVCPFEIRSSRIANKISHAFGLEFLVDMVFDPTTKAGGDRHPLIHGIAPHSVTEDLE